MMINGFSSMGIPPYMDGLFRGKPQSKLDDDLGIPPFFGNFQIVGQNPGFLEDLRQCFITSYAALLPKSFGPTQLHQPTSESQNVRNITKVRQLLTLSVLLTTSHSQPSFTQRFFKSGA